MKSKCHYDFPIGPIWIAEEKGAITYIGFSDDKNLTDFNEKETPLIKKAADELTEYFNGQRKEFDLPLLFKGTAFQESVWQALQQIPYGETRSYKDIAIQIGNPKALRAVGMANNRNPISIVIPCHRVIGHKGDLVGYGGGIHIKKYLLDLEKSNSNTHYFSYGEKEITYLKSRDPLLGKAIDEIGLIKREVIPDMFMALVNSIIGQQISTKAQITIWNRMQEKFAPITPQNIGSLAIEELQTIGISMRKASYIKEIADLVNKGELDFSQLNTMSDKEVCTYLTKLKGVGVWTAEMLMIFSMQRPNILSWNDLGIHRGLRMLYGHGEITPELFAKYKDLYSPYASVASLYLWEIAGGACPHLTDPGSRK
ncbi:MAG: methylated-DNA--[protein]-cysteine S-methyltransferase [Syntrophomonadaceae bacterium]|nr:methylated-DNA--[protein]-cysteine S-methyltransferase [Syntrophomonadaceae bacterium]